MEITRIPENGLPGGIMLLTEHAPTLEETTLAVRDFHLYPVLRDTAIVVLLDPDKLSPSDTDFLRRLGVPGYAEQPQDNHDS